MRTEIEIDTQITSSIPTLSDGSRLVGLYRGGVCIGVVRTTKENQAEAIVSYLDDYDVDATAAQIGVGHPAPGLYCSGRFFYRCDASGAWTLVHTGRHVPKGALPAECAPPSRAQATDYGHLAIEISLVDGGIT